MAMNKISQQEIAEIQSLAGPRSRIVFISGIFNTIHPGHARLFKYAHEQGDILVVGVLDDHLAPGAILDSKERLTAVSAISFINYSFVLQDFPEEFIASLRPATVVKGLEYRDQLNPEKAVVEGYGGRLLFSSGESLFSSLDLLRNEVLEVDHSAIRVSKEFLKRHDIEMSDLEARIQGIQKMRIAVIGDTIIDEYVTCDAVGLSREDPTVVVRPLYSRTFLGGAGIVSAHARSLGCQVNFFTVLGLDQNGKNALDFLSEYKVDVNAFHDDTRPTTHKKRFRAQDKTMLRVNTFSEIGISDLIQDEIFNALVNKDFSYDLIILSDFNYGILPQSLVNRITELALKNGIPIIADSQTSSQTGDISRYTNMSLITPTEQEVRVALRDSTSGLAQVASALMHKSSCKSLIVTLGSEGIFIQSKDRDRKNWLSDRLPAFNNLARDTAGAGDALLVAAGLAVASGASVWEAAYLGSIAAACQVSRIGNLPLTQNEMMVELRRSRLSD